jgi:hypothetical protein
MNAKSTKQLKSQRGIAMMVALLALLLLAAIGMGLMFMADTENSVNNNYRDSQKAYFAARAGAEQARLLIATDANINAQAFGLDGFMPKLATKTGMIYLVNPTNGEPIDPTAAAGNTVAANPYLDDQLCWEKYTGLALLTGTGPCGSNLQAQQLLTTNASFTSGTMPAPGSNGADALAFKWVRIANKQNFMGPLGQFVSATAIDGTVATGLQQVCWNGSQELVIPAGTTCQGQPNLVLMPVWELTSLAATPKFGQNPGSRRMVQMEVAFRPPLIPPAPISTQAPVALQGSFVLNAYDFCSCTCTTTGSGNNTTTTCNQPINPSCKQNAHAIFTENKITQSGTSGQTITMYGTNATGNASLQFQDPWPDNLNINTLINQYKNQAGTQSPPYSSSCTGTSNPLGIPPTYKNCGTQSNQTYGNFPSSLLGPNPVEPATYTGGVTEYIPGSVQLTSGANGGGVLIVDGDLDIHGGLNWYGLILVRGKVTFTGGAGDSTNLFGAILAGQDVTATDQAQQDGDQIGGSVNMHYDICALNNSGKGNPPQLLATHEIMY